MGYLSLHGIVSIKMENKSYDGEYGSVKLIIQGESGEGTYHFTVILYGDEGLSIEMGGMKPTSGAVVELVEKANAA